MIRRSLACLRKGGFHNIFGRQESNAFSHAGGALEPNFWHHGAFLIGLPDWWRNLLQAPFLESSCLSTPPTAQSENTTLSDIARLFQDLARPIQTLSLIREINRSTITHQHAVCSIQKQSRNFTSVACALLSTSPYWQREPEVGHGAAATVTFSKDSSDDSQVTWLDHLLENKDWSTCRDQVWQICQRIVDGGQTLGHQRLIRVFHRLDSSESQLDTERLLALYGSLPTSNRRAVYYSFATTAALKLNDVDTAIQIHHEAMEQLKSPASASRILRYAVSHTNWDVAVAIWQAVMDSDSSQIATSALWAEIKSLPVAMLLKRAFTLPPFAVRDRFASLNSHDLKTRFCLDFLRTTFSIRTNHINVKQWASAIRQLKEFANSEYRDAAAAILHEGLEQMLSFTKRECNLAALEAFLWFRENCPDMALSDGMYLRLFSKCSGKYDMPITHRLVEDWRESRGALNLEIYQQVLKVLAGEGHIDLFNKVYGFYRLDHVGTVDPSIAGALLNLYYKRADVEGVVRAFHHIETFKGQKIPIEFYNTVMLTFARIGDVASVESWLRTLEASGLEPNEETYLALMWPYSKRGDRLAVQSLVEQASLRGVEQNKTMFEMSILALVNNGDLIEAEQRLEEWSSNHACSKPNSAWNMLLHAYAFKKNLAKVRNLHNRMHELGIISNSRTYGSLVLALCAASFPDEARRLIFEIMPRVGLQPGETHYADVMRSYMQEKQYDAVFKIFDRMIAQGVQPKMDSRNVILRTVTRQDWHSDSLDRTRRALDWILENVDPAELAHYKSSSSVGSQRLDHAFVSTYFGYVLAQYGLRGAFAQVSETYEEYVRTARRFSNQDVTSSPPLNILSALLVSQYKAGNHEEVERCWYLAIEECEKLSRKAFAADGPRSGWVLPNRRLVINLPLRHYMPYLSQQGRYAELVEVVTDLVEDGYELTRSNWNSYIRYLCESKLAEYQVHAFELCEQKLMHDWNGWTSFGSPRYLSSQIERSIHRGHRIAEYRTIIWLARASIDIGFGRAKRKAEGLKAMHDSGAIAKTLDAVQNLPRVADADQNSILGDY